MDAQCNEVSIDPIVSHYDRNADRLGQGYESLAFETVHHDLLPYLPELPARVLDVGAGSGRDAGALAARGYDVLAVEPSIKLRALGSRFHVFPNLIWRADQLPELGSLEQSERFDLVLCSAVWMHLRRDAQRSAMRRIADLCRKRARFCITFRTGMMGEETLVLGVSNADVIADAELNGFQLLKKTTSPDWCERTGVDWISLIFKKV